ncbi:hypothetical protein [Streptomyces anulatus]|uniref:hypothetical protein n=1 Tax=Streptomyces anulatus TaxID=1892 RepID=UPI001C27C33A|nr:hypothetical protein [Streptomyces anulatus]
MDNARSARPPVPRTRPVSTPRRPRTPPLGPHPEWEFRRIFQEPYYRDPLIRWETEQDAQDFQDSPPRRPGPRRPPS